MRRFCRSLLFIVPILLAGGCTSRDDRQPQPQFRPTATVKDIMVSIIDPAGRCALERRRDDRQRGGHRRARAANRRRMGGRSTGRHSARRSDESASIPGRQVARPGEKSENPRIELEPETIQKLIADDPATWARLVDRPARCGRAGAQRGQREECARVSSTPGENIEHACEACHQHYWYPPKDSAGVEDRSGGIRRIAERSGGSDTLRRSPRAARSRVTFE